MLGYLYESEDEQPKICFSYELVSQDYRLSMAIATVSKITLKEQ